MRRAVLLLSLIIGALSACAPEGPDDTDEPQPKLRETDPSRGKKDDDSVSTKSPTEPTRSEPAPLPSPPDPPPAPPPPPPPPAPPAKPVCALGNGLYCGGNGVPGNPNELYRCIDGVPQLEKVCAFECARMPDGKNDVCSCALGNGLYCGGNGVNGDPDKLYRCTGGVVSLEKVCGAGCELRPNGYNDRCF